MIHDKKSMFLRQLVGDATLGTEKFEMSVNMSDFSPIVRLPDGRWWTIGWRDLLAMAEQEAAPQPHTTTTHHTD